MRVVVRAGPAAGTRSIASGPVAQWDDWWLRPFGGFTCPDTRPMSTEPRLVRSGHGQPALPCNDA